MKRFMKGCAITALIFAILGCILGMIGSSMAGRTTISQVVDAVTGGRVHMNPEKWWKWGINIGGDILDDIDIGNFSIGHFDTGNFSTGDFSTGEFDIRDASMFDSNQDIFFDGDVEKYCPGTNIRNLEIEVGGCYLETRPSGDDLIYLEMENAHKFQGYVEDGTLYIKSTTGSVNHWSDIGKRKIIVYLPDNYEFHKVEIEFGAGEMVFDGLIAEEAFLEAGAGRIVADCPRVNSLDISIGAGSIELTDMEIDRLEAEVGMGEFLADGKINKSASVDCSMGNVDMRIEGSEQDFNYSLDGAMGNISVGSASFSGFSQEKKIDNKARKDMEIECSMGNITISFGE